MIADQIDAYEQRHGRLDDRSCFDGDIVVPPHLRNATATLGHRSSRLSLLSGLSRSRTFLTLPSVPGGGRQTLLLHGSVPDLSRSMPSTPLGSVGRQRGQQRGDSVESVLEEDQHGIENCNGYDTSPLSITHASTRSVLKDGVELRRKSEHDVIAARAVHHASPVRRGPQVTTPSAYRNGGPHPPVPPPPPKRISSTSSFIGIPFRVRSARRQSNVMPTPPAAASVAAAAGSPLRRRKESPLIISASATSLHNITAPAAAADALELSSMAGSNSKWGNVRNSNSFSTSLNVGSLSTKYTIPRPHLVPVTLNGIGEPVALTDQQIILKALGADDSAA